MAKLVGIAFCNVKQGASMVEVVECMTLTNAAAVVSLAILLEEFHEILMMSSVDKI